MNQRLERILVKLAQRHAPMLLTPGWQGTTENLKLLARGLADFDFLVVMAKVPDRLMPERDAQIQNWANAYARFHNLMAHNLFPNYSALNASFADDALPPVIVFQAKVAPIVEVMAGYLVPYVASRQAFARVAETEIRELIDEMLAKLATTDLSEPVYHMLVKDGIASARRLIELPMQHIALTDFDRNLFPQLHKPATLPRTGELPKLATQPVAAAPTHSAPAQPPHQPEPEKIELKLEQLEEIEYSPLTPTERMFIRPVNLAFERKPPVPDLPNNPDRGKSG
ncbi:MAG: hypothetical protein H7X77_04950 [Anaerolineae bacterium]|nr:hypothetical protein [Anaerolineae bacterium]